MGKAQSCFGNKKPRAQSEGKNLLCIVGGLFCVSVSALFPTLWGEQLQYPRDYYARILPGHVVYVGGYYKVFIINFLAKKRIGYFACLVYFCKHFEKKCIFTSELKIRLKTMWKQYEEKLHQVLTKNYPESNIEFNDSIFGLYSKTERQIDIALRGTVAGSKVLGIIDCKYFNKTITLKVIESFIGMMQDVNANFGIMITNKGYSKASKNRVKYSNLKLDVLNFDELGEITLTVDYFFNQNIHGLQLSKSEFFKRNKQNTNYFDEEKSNYQKRILVFKEGFAHNEFNAKKKLLENSMRSFRDFSQLNKITLIIPAIVNESYTNYKDVKNLFRCEITRTQIESFLNINAENLREDISNWRNDFLKNINKTMVNEFTEKYVTSKPYEDYEKIVFH